MNTALEGKNAVHGDPGDPIFAVGGKILSLQGQPQKTVTLVTLVTLHLIGSPWRVPTLKLP
jgi:hypothetical protein